MKVRVLSMPNQTVCTVREWVKDERKKEGMKEKRKKERQNVEEEDGMKREKQKLDFKEKI